MSPTTVLRSIRGPISDARIAYPDVLHLEVRDASGALWRLATQDAEWTPADPAALVGRSIESAEMDGAFSLCFGLSDGTVLAIRGAEPAAENDPPSWELIGPDGFVLEFGPGLRWQISKADAPSRHT
jgi:hypothetical protein